MRRVIRLLRRAVLVLAGGISVILLGLALPIAWTELNGRGSAISQAAPISITAEEDRRAEARTYLPIRSGMSSMPMKSSVRCWLTAIPMTSPIGLPSLASGARFAQ